MTLTTPRPGPAPGGRLQQLRHQWEDPLVRNSMLLMANMVMLSGLAFVFWVVAGRLLPPSVVGTVTTTMSSVTLWATVGALGLPVALVAFLRRNQDVSRGVLFRGLAATAVASAVIVAVAIRTPLTPPYAATGSEAAWLTLVLVVVTAVASVQDAAFIAGRRAHLLLVKNVIGGVAKIVALLAWNPGSWDAHTGVHNLMVIQVGGTVLPAVIAWWLQRRVLHGPARAGGDRVPGLLGYAMGNYGAALISMLPMTLSPLLVIRMLGSEQAAYFTMPMMLLALINVVPNAVAQSLLAENASGTDRAANLRRAGRMVYLVMVPVVIVVLLAAELALSVFGPDYAAGGSGLLRLVTLASLASALCYLVNSAVNSSGDSRGFLLLSSLNAALVLGLIAALGGRGLTWVGIAWLLAQVCSAVLAGGYLWLTRHRALATRPAAASATTTRPGRVLSYPRDPNPYQEHLHRALADEGVQATYLPERWPSATLNLAALPAELAWARLRGATTLHLHWVFRFRPGWAGRLPGGPRLMHRWFRFTMLSWPRLLGYRLVWTAHNHLPHNPVFDDDVAARRALCARADRVIVHSESAGQALVDEFGLDPAKLTRIPIAPVALDPAGRPRHEVRAGLGLTDDDLLVGMVGRIEGYKGALELLRAHTDAGSPAGLLIAGTCPDPQLRRQVQEAAGGPRHTLDLRHLSDAEFAGYVRALDLAVMPFTRITTSASVLSALVAGVPVALPDDVLTDLDEPGVLRFPRDGLTELLRTLTPDGVRQAREQVAGAELPGWDEIAARTAAVYAGGQEVAR